MSINNLAESIASIFLLEDENSIPKIVVYSGRFQPFHMGHFQTYEMLCKQFGKQNVYIATSNKTDSIKSPFDFNDKIRIITSLFAVPSDKIVNVKNPYNPTEILSKFDSNKIAYIAAVSEKDGDRLNHGKYFKPYKSGQQLLPMKQEGYFYVYPMAPFKVEGKPINATTIRSMFGNAVTSNEDKMAFFKQIYPKYDGRIFDLLIKKISSLHESINENLLLMGGGAGHLTHLYEDPNLTFGQLKDIITKSLTGKLDAVQEKMDGQNLMVTWKNGKLLAARNQGDIKNFGERAMDIDAIALKFSGRGAIQQAFTEAMKDLSKAISSIDENLKQELFKEGKCFLNLEVLYPDTENVIPYGATQLLMHHFREYDESGKQISQDNEGVSKLESALERVQQTTQKTFAIKKTNPVEIQQTGKGAEAAANLTKALDRLMAKYHVSDDTKLSVFNGKKWANKMKRAAENTNAEVSNDLAKQLLKRWLYKDKSVTIKNIINGVQSDAFKSWIIDTDKKSDEINKEHLHFIEILSLKLGVEVLKKAKAFATLNADSAVQKIKSELQKTIDTINNSDDEKGIQLVKTQLDRLNAIGGFDAIVPSEGIVFTYNNKLYKLTGSFAPINRILGYLKFK